MSILTIFQTSDVHGYIAPHDYNQPMVGGLSKIATAIEIQKSEHNLIIDSGDITQGSPLTYYLANEINLATNPIVECMNKIGYDVFTPGNHEFNYGLDYLTTAINSFKQAVLCANIDGLPNTKPYKIFEYDNCKVAVIGLTTSYIPNWEMPKNIEGLEFNNPVEVYRQYEQTLKEEADIIIVNYHGGFECDLTDNETRTETQIGENQGSELVREFDSIDILLTGHQHRIICQKINGVVCVQPENMGKNLSKICIDTESKEIISYELIQPDNDTNLVIDNYMEQLNEDVDTYLDKVVTTLSEDALITDIFSARKNSHSLVEFLHQVQLEKTGADISAISLFDSAIGFKKDVSVRQIYLNYPFPNTLVVLKMKGSEINAAIEKSYEYFQIEDGEITVNQKYIFPKKTHYNYDIFAGVKYDVDLTKPEGMRVTSNLENDQDYTIVINNYRHSNHDIYPMYKDKEIVNVVHEDMIDILIAYCTSKPEIKIDKLVDFKLIK